MKRFLRGLRCLIALALFVSAGNALAGTYYVTDTVSVSAAPNPVGTGQVTTLTASVYCGGVYCPQSGTLTFYDGGTSIGSLSIYPYQQTTVYGSMNYAPTTAGVHTITASYSGTYVGGKSPYYTYYYHNGTSAPYSLTVIGATTTTLAAAPSPSTVNQAVTLAATVSGASPTGTVTFMDGTTALGAAALTGGQATFSQTWTTPATHSLTAVYGGDANNASSTSAAVSQVVNPPPTTTTLASSINPSTLQQQTNLTATVTGANPTGTVTFKDGTTVLGTLSLMGNGTAIWGTSFTTLGTHSLTAVYSGDANNAPSTSAVLSQTVNRALTSINLISSANPSATGTSVTLNALFYGGDSPTGTVTFWDGTTNIGTVPLPPITGAAHLAIPLNYTFTTAGTHSLTASYSGDTNNQPSTSPPLSQSVLNATTTTLTAAPNPSSAGQAVTLTAAVTGTNPTGTVTFMDGTTTLGTGTITGGQATLSYAFMTAGAHSLTAAYGGDASNATSTSAAVSQTVNVATSTTTLTGTPNPSVAGQAVTLTATVTGASPTGSVTFKDGAVTLGTVTVSAGQATLNYTFTTAGAHSLTAVYGGDANNSSSTSAAVTQTVNQVATTTALTAAPNPSVAGQAVSLTATVSGYAVSGTVTFMDGTATLGTATISAGQATLSYAFTTAGAHSLTAVYSGDANNTASTSAAVNQTVNPAATTTALTAAPNPAKAGQVVTLTATVSGVNPTGTVTFYDGATALLAGVPLNAGVASINTSFTTVGPHSLTAAYSGDANNNPSTSPAVSLGVYTETISYFHDDAEGTPLVATDAAGNLLWSESYRPYGDPVQTPLDANNHLWYTGKSYDSSTGLTYLGARYYDPLVGRFMGVDPKGFDEANLHSFNRYAYANNNPYRFVDPSGMAPEEEEMRPENSPGRTIEEEYARVRIEELTNEIRDRYNQKYTYESLRRPGEGYDSRDTEYVESDLRRFEAEAQNKLQSGNTCGPLYRIHSEETITSGEAGYSYRYWSGRTTDEIIRSLRPGNEEALTVKPDGAIIQGNTRTLILEQRGVDINSLPRETLKE